MENIMTVEERMYMLNHGPHGFDWARWAMLMMAHNVRGFSRQYRFGFRWTRDA